MTSRLTGKPRRQFESFPEVNHGFRLTRKSRRQIVIFCVLLIVILLLFERSGTTDLGIVTALYSYSDNENKHPYPPTYKKLRQYEDNLPQHNLDLPFPEGRNGRYVKFSNQAKKLGWNNVLNEA